MEELIKSIGPTSTEIESKAQHKIDFKTKPLGSLGYLEDLAIKISRIQNQLTPEIKGKTAIVFAGDHGICEEGVSAFPAEVTPQMVQNFLNGGAAINVLCRHHDIRLKICDVGVNFDFEAHPDLLSKKIRKGTSNFAIEAAMSEEECRQALQAGADAFFELNHIEKIDILALGEMGIGNTSSATAIISSICSKEVEEIAGRGTGVDDAGLQRKVEVISKALKFQKIDNTSPLDILRKVGGFEIAAIAGAAIAAASQGCVVVLDGVISTAAGLVAYLFTNNIRDYFIAGHKSVEPAQAYALDYMGLRPVMDLGMRLGEGTGATLTIDLCVAACKIMCEMASFEEAGVSEAT